MSQPGPEARIANLEKEAMSLGARIEEAAADTAESLREMRLKPIHPLQNGGSNAFRVVPKGANS